MTPKKRYASELIAQAAELTECEQAEWRAEIAWALDVLFDD